MFEVEKANPLEKEITQPQVRGEAREFKREPYTLQALGQGEGDWEARDKVGSGEKNRSFACRKRLSEAPTCCCWARPASEVCTFGMPFPFPFSFPFFIEKPNQILLLFFYSLVAEPLFLMIPRLRLLQQDDKVTSEPLISYINLSVGQGNS